MRRGVAFPLVLLEVTLRVGVGGVGRAGGSWLGAAGIGLHPYSIPIAIIVMAALIMILHIIGDGDSSLIPVCLPHVHAARGIP